MKMICLDLECQTWVVVFVCDTRLDMYLFILRLCLILIFQKPNSEPRTEEKILQTGTEIYCLVSALQ